jgi:O-antigen/teichoic acid export membrane protein
MDKATKERLKWKYFRLVLLLDLIILFVAFGVIALFLAPPDRKILVFTILILMTGIMSFYFRQKYRETRRWLDEQVPGDPDRPSREHSTDE